MAASIQLLKQSQMVRLGLPNTLYLQTHPKPSSRNTTTTSSHAVNLGADSEEQHYGFLHLIARLCTFIPKIIRECMGFSK